MHTIHTVTAFYPQFTIGDEPRAIECALRIVEDDDRRRYLKTPFAMLNAHDDDDHTRSIDGITYFATAEECLAMMNRKYPHWREARPIAYALDNATRNLGRWRGEYEIERKTGLNPLNQELYEAARGHRAIKLTTIRKAVKQLAKK